MTASFFTLIPCIYVVPSKENTHTYYETKTTDLRISSYSSLPMRRLSWAKSAKVAFLPTN